MKFEFKATIGLRYNAPSCDPLKEIYPNFINERDE